MSVISCSGMHIIANAAAPHRIVHAAHIELFPRLATRATSSDKQRATCWSGGSVIGMQMLSAAMHFAQSIIILCLRAAEGIQAVLRAGVA